MTSKLVPIEPNDEQVSAGMVAALLESVDKPFMWSNAVRASYQAMLQAAPEPDDGVVERVARAICFERMKKEAARTDEVGGHTRAILNDLNSLHRYLNALWNTYESAAMAAIQALGEGHE